MVKTIIVAVDETKLEDFKNCKLKTLIDKQVIIKRLIRYIDLNLLLLRGTKFTIFLFIFLIEFWN